MLKNFTNKKISIILALAAIVLVGGTIYSIQKTKDNKIDLVSETEATTKDVELYFNSSEDSRDSNIVNVDLKVSHLPSNIYSSASFSINFDKDRLEFIDLKKGDILTYSSKSPDWQYDVNNSNKTGLINVIYLDSSGGRESFTNKSISSDKNSILRLEFKLKDNIENADGLSLKIEDAVFATIKGDLDNTSLSTKKKTIKTKNFIFQLK